MDQILRSLVRDRAGDFEWEGTLLVGRTPVGRTTVLLLAVNDWQRIELRDNLESLGQPFGG